MSQLSLSFDLSKCLDFVSSHNIQGWFLFYLGFFDMSQTIIIIIIFDKIEEIETKNIVLFSLSK